MQFLSKYRWTSLIRMLKTVKVTRITCPVGFYQKDNCNFLNEKGLKLTPKMTKKPTKLSCFRNFYAIFVTISTDFVD